MSSEAASQSQPDAHSVPVVDISPFILGTDSSARKQCAQDLREILRVHGWVGISGHGISSEFLAETFSVMKKFFDLPYEEKVKSKHPYASIPYRGYRGLGKDNVAAKTAIEASDSEQKDLYLNTLDLKETFDSGSEEGTTLLNSWPPEDIYAGFREFTLKLYWDLNELWLAILEALIMSLDLKNSEADAIRVLHTGHDNQLRFVHYPPVDINEADKNHASPLGAHRDWSTFTLLFQDTVGGLEYLDEFSNKFVKASPIDGVLIMNVGDMLERISNGLYTSPLHQVVVHEPSQSRYSIPYFIAAIPNGIIEPQESLVRQLGGRKYEPVTPMGYAQKMYDIINA